MLPNAKRTGTIFQTTLILLLLPIIISLLQATIVLLLLVAIVWPLLAIIVSLLLGIMVSTVSDYHTALLGQNDITQNVLLIELVGLWEPC